MYDFMTLRGVIFSKYKTIGDFAAAIGWTRNKASRIVNGITDPDIDDIERLADVLDINTPDALINIFFASLSTKWTCA